jgi:hypothetical protein
MYRSLRNDEDDIGLLGSTSLSSSIAQSATWTAV